MSQMDNNQLVLQVSNLSKRYDNNVQALKDVSFEVKQGELVSIIGPSGSGKSTLLRCINRMIDASAGDVKFLDWDVTQANKKEIKEIRKNIGMIFQHYNLVYRLNALENVMHGKLGSYSTIQTVLGLYKQEDIQRAVELLNMLGLQDNLYQQCSKLSGGQKQRVGIARALIQNPKIMLCDEPIASLDPQASKIIMEYLRDIVSTYNIPCLVNLHQVDVAMKYSDRIIGIHQGTMVFNGHPKDLNNDVIEKIYGVKIEDLISNVEYQS